MSGWEAEPGRLANSWRRWAGRFQGRKLSISAGGLPPAAAQLCKYHANQRRGFKSQRLSVATIENIAAVKQTLHSEPEP